MNIGVIFVIGISLFFTGCAHKGGGKSQKNRYHKKHDGAPAVHEIPANLASIPDAVPKDEPKSKYGNPAKYQVFKKTYSVLDSNKGFKERGGASWYGNKFHGYRTSSGEKYDMYAMTAAHKTLPIPTYLRVKNLENGKDVIVKVNDRGPFHAGRVVDLSYAAAHRIGMLGKGTANVEIVALDAKSFNRGKDKRQDRFDKNEKFILEDTRLASLGKNKKLAKHDVAKNSNDKGNHYLQLGAFKERKNAEKLKTVAQNVSSKNKIQVVSSGNSAKPVFKVQVGPIKSLAEIHKLKSRLVAANLPEPITVHE